MYINYEDNKNILINTQYMRNSNFVQLLKMEYVSKINIFGLKMMVKSGLELAALRMAKSHSEQKSGVILTSTEPNIFRMLFSIKKKSLLYLWLAKKPHSLHEILTRLVITENHRFFGQPKVRETYNIIKFCFLMENSILKIFGSTMGVKVQLF